MLWLGAFHKLVQAACMRCHGIKCPLLTAFFSSLSSFSPGYFPPRRGCPRLGLKNKIVGVFFEKKQKVPRFA